MVQLNHLMCFEIILDIIFIYFALPKTRKNKPSLLNKEYLHSFKVFEAMFLLYGTLVWVSAFVVRKKGFIYPPPAEITPK
jgi:hypothetical protein